VKAWICQFFVMSRRHNSSTQSPHMPHKTLIPRSLYGYNCQNSVNGRILAFPRREPSVLTPIERRRRSTAISRKFRMLRPQPDQEGPSHPPIHGPLNWTCHSHRCPHHRPDQRQSTQSASEGGSLRKSSQHGNKQRFRNTDLVILTSACGCFKLMPYCPKSMVDLDP
jgi:hypothetical protein